MKQGADVTINIFNSERKPPGPRTINNTLTHTQTSSKLFSNISLSVWRRLLKTEVYDFFCILNEFSRWRETSIKLLKQFTFYLQKIRKLIKIIITLIMKLITYINIRVLKIIPLLADMYFNFYVLFQIHKAY